METTKFIIENAGGIGGYYLNRWDDKNNNIGFGSNLSEAVQLNDYESAEKLIRAIKSVYAFAELEIRTLKITMEIL